MKGKGEYNLLCSGGKKGDPPERQKQRKINELARTVN